ncbi:hypothetical protein BS78_10G018000 [Paspalum vaginatum]|nr:hypothetical protein BS78_10G018000 [Paspalum vaginatum]
MAPAPPATSGGRRQLEAKHYILAALAATLISAAVVTMVSVVLSPARIGFAVTKASSSHASDTGDNGGVLLNLTIAAHNPSGRAAVKYESMFVDVSNNTGPEWENWLRANLATAMPLRLPPRNVTEIQASVPLVGGPFTNDFTGNRTSHSFSVLITTVARFKIGVAWTRLFDIKVSCRPVDFFANKSTTAGCHAA